MKAIIIALCVSLCGFAPRRKCEAALYFSEYNIAKSIEMLGQRDGEMFALSLHGIPTDVIAKRYGLTDTEVLRRINRGMRYLIENKDKGL